MSLTIPSYIKDSGVVGAPLKYKWDSDIALKFFAAKDQDLKLYDAIDKANFKAKFALGIAITEWIVWRMQGQTDIKNALNKIECAWARAIDLKYGKDLTMELKSNHEDKLEGSMELTLKILGMIDTRYKKGSVYLAEHVVKQAVLARHLLPNKKEFSDWLTGTIKKLVKTFPNEAEYNEEIGIYDASKEKPVPREFFEPSFKYSEAAAEKALQNFLKNTDKSNPYIQIK